jgi:aerobic-type carbon monoxide dehydrogenase small subunit (CoxS/CutS family)
MQFTLNGKPLTYKASPDRSLLHFLRSDLYLMGTKDGCDGAGHCGTCTVLIDGEVALACRVPLSGLEGKQVLTIEGLTRNDHSLTIMPSNVASARRG